MDYVTDKKIVEAFLAGNVKGLGDSRSPEYIQTQISHIFLYPETVYKLYRRDNESFNKLFVDLGDEATRKKFCEEDFFFNRYFNPRVYLDLLRIRVNGSDVEIRPRDESGYDWIIKMRRIDPARNLTALLLHGSLKEDDFRSIGYQMTKMIAEFPRKPETSRNYYEIMKIDVDDVEKFAYLAGRFIKKEDVKRAAWAMKEYLERRKDRFAKITEKDFVYSIDNHSDNVFYNDGELSFVDIYPPKEDWRVVEPLYVIYRLSTDVEVLAGRASAKALIEGYKNYYGVENADESLRLFYQLYGATLKSAYLFMHPGEDRSLEAKKYWQFAEDKIRDLEQVS